MKDISIIKLDKSDIQKFVQVITLFENVFEMQDFVLPDHTHLQKLLQKENFHVFAATSQGNVVGGLSSYVLDQYYTPKPLAYIYDLAVANHFQQKGVGKSLITSCCSFFKSKGFEEVFVQADRIDEGAISFYRAIQPDMEEDVIHFSYVL